MSSQQPLPDTQAWVLEPESEYRFELDPGASLAIKVRYRLRSPLAFLTHSAPERQGGNFWRRTSHGQILSLWPRMQSRRLHLARMYH
jgi:hypothetical protein